MCCTVNDYCLTDKGAVKAESDWVTKQRAKTLSLIVFGSEFEPCNKGLPSSFISQSGVIDDTLLYSVFFYTCIARSAPSTLFGQPTSVLCVV